MVQFRKRHRPRTTRFSSITITVYTSFIVILTISHYATKALHQDSGHDRLGSLDSYKISWKGPPTEHDQKQLESDDENVIRISTKDNEKYVCIVPGVGNLNFDTSAKNSSSSHDQDDNKPKSPIQVLEPLLTGNFCSYKFEVFWIYELCHGKYLRQYHEERNKYKTKVTQEYYLGKMESDQIEAHDEEYRLQSEERARTGESMPTILINGQYKPYVMFNMTGGTKCDLTKKNRISKIVYACNDEPSLELYSIKETSTCEYEAIVLAPMLCQHEEFKIDVNTQHEIKCYSMEGSPLRPKKTLEYEEDVNEDDDVGRRGGQKRSRAYLQVC